MLGTYSSDYSRASATSNVSKDLFVTRLTGLNRYKTKKEIWYQHFTPQTMAHDPFDEILGMEEQFYSDGYRQGIVDGTSSGRVEGRTFGLEKGFEKYTESARLYGKSLIWANRIQQARGFEESNSKHDSAPRNGTTCFPSQLPPLPNNQRLAKHLKMLHALSESASLSTENTEEAVNDFDDRLKRAQAKEKIISKMTGDSKGDTEVSKMV
jgi:hypothetical protein